MFKRVSTILILLTGIAALFLGACSKENSTPSTGKTLTYNLKEPGKTLDPQLGTTVPSSTILEMCMEGLTIQGKVPGEMLPAGAESWDISKDGTVYTFHIRKDGKWSNGETITAHDYYFGMKRALEPVTAAQYAYMLYSIVNAKAYNESKIKDFSKVGIKIIDKFTLEITLKNVVPYFTQLLSNSVASPCNEKFLKKVGDQYCLNADTMLYNGPYVISEYVPNGKVDFLKNQNYWDKERVKVDNWTFLMVSNYNTAANMFRSGELDFTVISGAQIAQFKNNPNLVTKPDGSVWYLQFNIENKFFNNINIRKAVSMAIDRKVMVENIMKDGSQPAYAFVPPGLAGGKVDGKLITFRDRFPKKLLQENVAEAKKLYQKGLKEIGFDEAKEGKAKVKLLCQNNPPSMRQGQFIQEQLFQNLGLNVILEPNTFQAKTAKEDQEDFDFSFAGWLPDYNYPTTFLDMWVTNGGNNHTNWSNAAYDQDIKTGETNDNSDTRISALHNSEVLLMKELPIVPIYYRYSNWLIKPWLKGYVIRTSGRQIGFQWIYVDKK